MTVGKVPHVILGQEMLKPKDGAEKDEGELTGGKRYAQGKLCIKLVYRECNSSSYHLIQAFLGPIRAGFYQAFASLFGASLNKKYDPNGVDRLTERVVRQVESGQI